MKRRPTNTTTLAAALALASAACLIGGCGPTEHDPNVIATSRSGTIMFGDVEQRVRQEVGTGSTPDIGDLERRFRDAAETLVIEKELLGTVIDRDDLRAALGEEWAQLNGQATLEVFLERQAPNPIEIDEAEISRYYEDHRSAFQRKGRRVVWNLFRRYDDPDNPQPTLDLLESLRTRALDGEPFMLLAREYSQSETRTLDGRLGWIERGVLPEALETIAFQLEEGGVSPVLKTTGGAFLLHVSDVVPARTFDLEEARAAIARRLTTIAREQALRDLIDSPPPDGSILLESDELRRLMVQGDPAVVVLRIGDFQLTAAELREQVAGRPEPPVPLDDPFTLVEEVYRQHADRQRLVLQIVASGSADEPAMRRAIDARVDALAKQILLERRIQEHMLAAIDDRELHQFFDDNQALYLSPFRIRIASLVVPVAGDPVGRQRAMEEARDALASGRLNLSTAARELGGTVIPSSWIEPDELNSFEPKALSYLLQVGGLGFTQPYQLGRRLQLHQIEAWQEPTQLRFEDVVDRVRQDYLVSYQQQLYAAVADAILDEADFTYFGDVVRERLQGGTGPSNS